MLTDEQNELIRNYIHDVHRTDIESIMWTVSRTPKTADIGMEVDIQELFNIVGHEILEEVENNPAEVITLIQQIIKLKAPTENPPFISFKNIPLTKQNIWKLRNHHLNKLIIFEAYIRSITEPGIVPNSVTYECQLCREYKTAHRRNGSIPTITFCTACRHKGLMDIKEAHYFDRQKIILEEVQDNIEVPKTRSILGYIDRTLTKTSNDKQLQEGKKVLVYGILSSREVTKHGSIKEHLYYLKVNNIKPIEMGFNRIEITDSEEQQIKETIQRQGFIEDLKKSVLPYHKYDEEVKEGIILSLAGSPKISIEGVVKSTGNLNILLVGSPGCQPAGSKVLMSNGEWKNIEDIRTGDQVISPQPDGTTQYSKVTNTTSWYCKRMYDVYEMNRQKRKLYTCSYNHIIPFDKVRANKKTKEKTWGIVHMTAHQFSTIGKTTKSHTMIGFGCQKIEKFQGRDNCSIDPYTLGVYIGDGHFGKGQLAITSPDTNIISTISKIYPLMSKATKPNNKASSYYWSLNSPFAKELSALGLRHHKSGEKFIPKQALYSDYDYRIKLLTGLIDSDGYKDKGHNYSYCTKSSRLAEDIEFLVHSIGCSTRKSKVRKRCNDFVGEYYNLSIYLGSLRLPVLTERRKKEPMRTTYLAANRKALDVKLTSPGMVYGFGLDSPSKWYITDNYMITHNTGKSQVIRTAIKISPINLFGSGSSSSAIGLTAAIDKDERLNEKVIKPGLLPLCDKGFAGIDELDKIDADELGKLNDSLTSDTLEVRKAGLHRVFSTDTTIIAGMNPLGKRFDTQQPRDKQIGLNEDLKDRFALIFIMEPKVDAVPRREIGLTMLGLYSNKERIPPPLSFNFLQKYFAYIRRHNPELDSETADYLLERESKIIDNTQAYMSYRLVDKIAQISKAYARLSLEDVTKDHIEKAINILLYTLKGRDLLNKEGLVKYELMENIESQEERASKRKVRDLLLVTLRGQTQPVSFEDIKRQIVSQVKVEDHEIDEVIESLRRMGDIIEPKRGFFMSIG